MIKKINTKKDFNDFIDFLSDQNPEIQNQRAALYRSYAKQMYGKEELSPKSKAGYIISIIAPYLSTLIPNIVEYNDEPHDNHLKFKNIKDCFDKLLTVFRDVEQDIAFKKEFKDKYDFEQDFDQIYKQLILHNNNIYEFEFYMFSSIIEDIQNNSHEINLSSAQELIVSDKTYDYLNNNSNKFDDLNTIEKIIFQALISSEKSIKMEIIGRMYAYIESGYAQADLIDKKTHPQSLCAKNLYDTIIEYISNSDEGNFDSINEERNKKLSEIFTQRINEINISVKIDANEQSCCIKASELDCLRVAPSGTTDLCMQYYNHPNKLVVISCTSNETLYFTQNGSLAFNFLTHMRVIDKVIKNNPLKEISHQEKFSPCINLETPIEDINYISISPSIVKKSRFNLIFDKKESAISPHLKTMVANFPLIRAIYTYSSINSEDKNSHIDNSIHIGKNLICGKDNTDHEWYENLINSVKKQPVQKRLVYFNEKIADYLYELWLYIKNSNLKDNFIINAQNESTILGQTQFFLKEFPSLMNAFINKAILNPKTIPINKDKISNILEVAKEMLCENMYLNSEVCSTNIDALSVKVEKINSLINPKKIFKRKK